MGKYASQVTDLDFGGILKAFTTFERHTPIVILSLRAISSGWFFSGI